MEHKKIELQNKLHKCLAKTQTKTTLAADNVKRCKGWVTVCYVIINGMIDPFQLTDFVNILITISFV